MQNYFVICIFTTCPKKGKVTQSLPTLSYSQFGRVEKFLKDRILGIKKYFLAANRRADRKGGEGIKKPAIFSAGCKFIIKTLYQ